jgi:DDE domain
VGAAVHPRVDRRGPEQPACRRGRWFVDETYLKLAGRWVYLCRVIDQYGQVIDVLASPKRDRAATRRFVARALSAARRPTEATTDRAPAYPRVLDELVPEAWHVVEQYANNPIPAGTGPRRFLPDFLFPHIRPVAEGAGSSSRTTDQSKASLNSSTSPLTAVNTVLRLGGSVVGHGRSKSQ